MRVILDLRLLSVNCINYIKMHLRPQNKQMGEYPLLTDHNDKFFKMEIHADTNTVGEMQQTILWDIYLNVVLSNYLKKNFFRNSYK